MVDACRKAGRPLPAALQIDTGMSRLGLSPDELTFLLSNPKPLEKIAIQFVMSHLACADEPEHGANAAQLAAMHEASASFPQAPVCFSNSGGIFLGAGYHHQLMRPGIALYGGLRPRPDPTR